MTKTFTPVVFHRFTKYSLPVMMPLGKSLDGSFSWNFHDFDFDTSCLFFFNPER
jgi:hypothetical protein